MIDKILNANENNINIIQDEILELNSARFMYMLACKCPFCDYDKLGNAILKTDDSKYIRMFGSKFYDRVNFELFFNKVLEFNNSALIFYLVYDATNVDNKYYINAIDYFIKNNNEHFLFKLTYYFLIVLKRFDLELLDLVKDIYNLTVDNYIDVLENKYNEINLSYNNRDYENNGLSNHHYEGHMGYIPDMIVLHISTYYYRILDLFYDPNTEVSSHFVISRDGKVKQVIGYEHAAWANGTGTTEDKDTFYKLSNIKLVRDREDNANFYSYTIEHDSMDGTLTDEQYKASLETCIKIIKHIKEEYNYDFIIDREHIVGHNEVAPLVRTMCPGFNFPIDRLVCDLQKKFIHS